MAEGARIGTQVSVISKLHVVHTTSRWQMRKSVAVLGGFQLGVHFMLFAAKAISVTSLDHCLRIIEKSECPQWKALSRVKR